MRVGSVQVRLPAPTIRLRMTLLYGLVFLVPGAVLLTIGYELVRHNLNGLDGNGAYRDELRRFGLPTPPVAPSARARLRGSPKRSAPSCARTRSTGS